MLAPVEVHRAHPAIQSKALVDGTVLRYCTCFTVPFGPQTPPSLSQQIQTNYVRPSNKVVWIIVPTTTVFATVFAYWPRVALNDTKVLQQGQKRSCR